MENFYNLKILKDKNNFVIFLISNIFFITLLYFSNGYHLVGPIFLYIKFPYNLIYILMILINSILFSLSICLIKKKIYLYGGFSKFDFTSFFGTFFVILFGGCPGCLFGLLPFLVAFFEIHLPLYNLPFYGIELLSISIIFFLIGIYYLNKEIVCKIKPKIK